MIRGLINGRVFVSIDVANIFYSQRTLGWRVSYSRLKKYLADQCGDKLHKIFVYTATDVSQPQQQRFIQMLTAQGFIVTTKSVKKITTETAVERKKADFDVELTMDIMDNMSSFDTLLLFSGDSDFAPLIIRCRIYKKVVVVFSTKGHISIELIRAANRYINLGNLKNELELKQKSPQNGERFVSESR